MLFLAEIFYLIWNREPPIKLCICPKNELKRQLEFIFKKASICVMLPRFILEHTKYI